VLVAQLVLGGEEVSIFCQVLAVHYEVLPVQIYLQVGGVHPEGVDLLDGKQRHPDVLHQYLHGRLGVLVLQEDLNVLLVGVVRKLRNTLDETPPRLRVRPLERVVVPFRAGPDDEVRANSRAQINAAPQGVFSQAPESRIGVDESAKGVGRVGVESRGDDRQVHFVGGENARNLIDVVLIDFARVMVFQAV
jgi:hypothetical protein